MPNKPSKQNTATLSIETGKNWGWIIYSSIIGFLLIIIGIGTIFLSKNFFSTLIIIFLLGGGIILTLYSFYVSFFEKNKTLILKIRSNKLTLEDLPKSDDKDYNKNFLLNKIKCISHKSELTWAGLGEKIDKITILTKDGQEETLFDNTLLEAKLTILEIYKIIDFVKKHLKK